MFAARDRRLLSLSTLTNFLTGRWQWFARVFSSAFAAGITVFLCVAAVQLVQSEHEGGKILAYGIPIWTVQLIMPLGFGVIALRLLWHAADDWRGRVFALAVAGAMVWIGFHPPLSPARLVVPGLVALFVAVVLGAPIFVMLGGAALILVLGRGSAHRLDFADALFDGDQPHVADRAAVHAGRLFPGRRRRLPDG